MFADFYSDFNKPTDAPSFMKGYFSRKPDYIIRLAMIHSLSLDSSKKIRSENLMYGVQALNENEGYIDEVIRYMGMTDNGQKLRRVQDIVRKKGAISHSNLMRLCSHQVNAQELRDIIETLVQSHEITEVTQGKKHGYKWEGKK